ncbi:uncharacterized protein LOC143178268 [Calliopsis andreniformis]|uniref:uncharacterized protein LOC143178268 n=1 Tax=Calliopsis andreniformis TaxID=337506 RepID=UPI003FCE6C18
MGTHFHYSNTAQDELRTLQKRLNQTPLKIIQDLKNLCLYAPTNNETSQLISEEWMIIETLIGLLMIPLIATLETVLNDLDLSDEHIGDTTAVLKEELIRKFSVLENEILFVTHIMDLLEDSQTDTPSSSRCPNAKRVRLNANNNRDSVNKSVSLMDKMTLLMDSSDSEGEDEIPLNSYSYQNPAHLLIRKTITEYLAEKRVANIVDPLTWWKMNKQKYGLLFPIARHDLVTPSTSVPSEQMFSSAKLIYTPHRNRLEGEKTSKLLFLKLKNAKTGCQAVKPYHSTAFGWVIHKTKQKIELLKISSSTALTTLGVACT